MDPVEDCPRSFPTAHIPDDTPCIADDSAVDSGLQRECAVVERVDVVTGGELRLVVLLGVGGVKGFSGERWECFLGFGYLCTDFGDLGTLD